MTRAGAQASARIFHRKVPSRPSGRGETTHARWSRFPPQAHSCGRAGSGASSAAGSRPGAARCGKESGDLPVQGPRSRAADPRGREKRARGRRLHFPQPQGLRANRRSLREKIRRREGPAVAFELGESPAARHRRGAGRAVRLRHPGDERPGDGSDAPRAAARGILQPPLQGPAAGRLSQASPLRCRPLQFFHHRLQHQPRQGKRSARHLRGPDSPAFRGPGRDRSERRRLVRRRGQVDGRGEGPRILQEARRGETRTAQRPHADGRARRLGRDPARRDDLQPQRRAAGRKRRPDTLEGAQTHLRAPERDRRDTPRPPSPRGAAFCRLHALPRRADDPEGAQPGALEPRRGHAPQQVPLRDDRPGDHARRGRPLGETLVGSLPQRSEDPEGSRMKAPGFSLLASLFVAGAVLSTPVIAQVKPNATAAEVGLYGGPDRLRKLIEGAKQEGELNLYTSAQSDDMGALVGAYEKKYAVKVNVWRASSEKVLQRAVAEARANRNTVDVVETNGPEMESLHREKVLQQVKSPHHADLIAPAIRPHGEWVGTRLNVFVQAYNTQAVRKQDLPKTWEDLLDPKWKGKLGIEQEDSDWLAGLFGDLGEAKGTKLFKEIVAKNGMSVRKGHTLLAQLVVSGEVPLALTVYNYKAEQFKGKGAPIDWFSIGTAIARPNGVGVARRAPHPHAAVLFYDFEISEEGQRILAQRDFVPTSKKVDTPLNKLPLKFVDARVTLDEYGKWVKLYEEIFGKGQ